MSCPYHAYKISHSWCVALFIRTTHLRILPTSLRFQVRQIVCQSLPLSFSFVFTTWCLRALPCCLLNLASIRAAMIYSLTQANFTPAFHSFSGERSASPHTRLQLQVWSRPILITTFFHSLLVPSLHEIFVRFTYSGHSSILTSNSRC